MAENRNERSRTVVKKAGWAGLGIAGLAKFAFHVIPHKLPTEVYVGVACVGLAVTAWSFAPRVVHAWRSRHWRREAQATGRWPLAVPYRVVVTIPMRCTDVPGTLVFGPAWIRFDGKSKKSDVESVIDLGDVRTVRMQSTWIEIAYDDAVLHVKTRSENDRERLLWELAFRCNAAMERGIDAMHGPATSSVGAA